MGCRRDSRAKRLREGGGRRGKAKESENLPSPQRGRVRRTAKKIQRIFTDKRGLQKKGGTRLRQAWTLETEEQSSQKGGGPKKFKIRRSGSRPSPDLKEKGNGRKIQKILKDSKNAIPKKGGESSRKPWGKNS